MKRIMALLTAALILLPPDFAQGAVVSPEDLKPVLARVTKRLSQWLGALDDDLSAAARRLSGLDFNNKEARAVMQGLCIGRTYVVDAVIMDVLGKATSVRALGNERLDEKDIKAQEEVVAVEITRKPAMSCEFKSSAKINMIVFEYPIFGEGRSYRGSLSLLVDQKDFLSTIIKPIIRDTPGAVMIMQTDGNVVYSECPEFIDKNLFSNGIFSSMESLRSFARRVVAEEDGSGSYEYSVPNDGQKLMKKIAVWGTVRLYDSMWRVVVADEIK